MKRRIFEIRGTDRREELVNAEDTFTSQKVGGESVEYFSPQTGFVLLEEEKDYSMELPLMKRCKAIAEFSLEQKTLLGLRDSYYTIRQDSEKAQFFNPNNFYADYLTSINKTEIVCDVDRDVFLEGRTPKGFFFYPYSRFYGQKNKLVGFSEDLAQETIERNDIEWAKNLIVIEKSASAAAMLTTDFCKYTNSALITCGGQFNRGITKFVKRFVDDHQTELLCDADSYGCYMRKILNIGSKSLRYRNNKVRSKNLYDVGLFPSLAKKLDLPNDLEEKRPTPGNPAWKRMELLEQVGYPKEDIDIFKSGYTTELEALASKFKNSDGVPIGLELFLTKNMELMDLEVKPIPSWTENELRESCGQMLRSTIRNKIYQSFSELLDLRSVIDEEVEDKIELLLEEVCGKVEEIVKSKVDLTTDEVQGKAWEYFCSHPIQERMGIETLVKEAFEVTCDKVEVDIKELKEQLRKSLNTLLKNIKPKVKVKVFDIERSSKTRGDFFKTIYKKLKIKKGDERKMEEALR